MEAGAHTAENARKAQLGQNLTDLLGKKGDYANQLKLQLRDGLVKQYEFAQALGQKEQAAQIAAMLKKLGIDAAAKKAAADRAARKANQDANRNQSGDQFDKLHDPNSPYNPKNQPQAGSGGKNNSGLTPAEARKARASWRTALANARDKSNRHPQYSPGQLEHLFHGDPLLITAAAWMAVYGGVPRATARAMKRENGIHLPVYRPKQPRRPG